MASAICSFVTVGLCSIRKQTFSSQIQYWWTRKQNIMTTAARVASGSINNSSKERKGVWVEAKPKVCLHDVPTELIAGGLLPNSPITLSANLIDEQGKRFCSHAHYMADDAGQVDVSCQPSIGGSYTGVFPAGLLTTLSPAPEEFPFLRLYRRDPQIPWKITVNVSEGHLELQEQQKALANVELERHLMAPGVQRIPVREGRVRGTLFLPPGNGPFPGVIDMFGSVGGLMEFRAAMLASRGIAALALAFFAYEDLPKSTNSFDLEYFEEAVNILLSQPVVVKDRCGVVSVSKSTDIALSMATWLPKVKAVVCISGTPIAFDSNITYKGKTLLDGFKVGIEHLTVDEEGRFYPKQSLIRPENFDDCLPHVIPINEADKDTYFLVVSGDDDAWGTNVAAKCFQEYMHTLGNTNIQTVIYPGAGHMIEPPYGPLVHQSYHRYLPMQSEDGMENITSVRALWGGNAFDTCKAQEDLWIRMRQFLTRHIRDESSWYQSLIRTASKL